MKEIGSSGLHQTGGFILEEINPRLRGIHGMRIFREMSDNDPIIGGILYAIESLIRQVEWRVEPKDDSDAAVSQAEFMETVIADMEHTWEDFLSEVLTMLVYGWAYMEIVYKIRRGSKSEFSDGLIGWKKLGLRAQDSLYQWMLAPNGDILGMWQVDYYKASAPVLIPSQKALHFRVRSNRNNPEGRTGGILRNAYRPWFYTKRLQEFEAIGAERNLAGLPVMEVPVELLNQNAGPNEIALRTDLEKMIQEIKVDERMGALIPTERDRDDKPTGFRLKLLQSGGSRPFPIDETIQRYDKRIAQSVLAEFMMLGMDATGSFALASTKTKLFSVTLGSIMDGIASVVNRFGVSKLMRLNNVPQDLWPMVVHGDIEKQPLTEVSDFLQKLVGVGLITPTPKLERKLLEVAELGEVDDEAEEAFDSGE
jgi:hypothetical protein